MRTEPTEAEILKACLEYLNLQWGCKFWRRNVGAFMGEYRGRKRFMRFGARGMCDIEGVAYGRHVEIEIKRPGKAPTLDQAAWITEMQNLGAIAFYCTSLEDCIGQWEKIIELRREFMVAWKDYSEHHR